MTASLAAIATALTPGNTYYFQIRAINIYGPGLYSQNVSYVAGSAPNAPAAPTLSLSNYYVVIQWIAPVDNYVAIDAYQILI